MSGATDKSFNKNNSNTASRILAARQDKRFVFEDHPGAVRPSSNVVVRHPARHAPAQALPPPTGTGIMGVKERFTNDGNVGVGKALDKRVVLNVGGTRHETWVSTLERLPGSRLALLAHLEIDTRAQSATT